MTTVDVVIPTIGRSSLRVLLDALRDDLARLPGRVMVVNDRPDRPPALPVDLPVPVEVVPGRKAGPATARNLGWRASRAEWVEFLDDDVVPSRGWLDDLLADLRACPDDVAGSQGRIRVPAPSGRRPTDWERNVMALEGARWATADMAYRRSVLHRVNGFDERFPRAYREDADLALRVRRAGFRLARGNREVEHPVGPAGPWVSVGRQAGNADDALMRRLHGRHWRRAAEVGSGTRARHVATAAAGLTGLAAAASGRRGIAVAAAAAWAASTGRFAMDRIAPGPRTRREVVTMAATSVVIPPLAVAHWVRGWLATRHVEPDQPGGRTGRPRAVLFDRDGTLVEDVPYNGDPTAVELRPGARSALERLRAAGLATAVISNQSGVARGLIGRDQVDAVNRRVERLLGPLGPVLYCPHGPDDGCACRKPAPGLVLAAAAELGVDPRECVVVGDIGADIDAALAAGARAVLVPTPATRREEVRAAPEVADTLEAAVETILEMDA